MRNSDAKTRVVYFLEDDPLILETITSLLELQFAGALLVQPFTSLLSLRQACEQIIPDLIIADLNVTDSGPVAVCSFLEQTKPDDLPIIVASANMMAMKRLFDGLSRFSQFSKGDDPILLVDLVAQRLSLTGTAHSPRRAENQADSQSAA